MERDYFYVPPNETVRVMTEFGHYADPELPCMFHCHIHQHEDRGMMGSTSASSRGSSRDRSPTTGTEQARGWVVPIR